MKKKTLIVYSIFVLIMCSLFSDIATATSPSTDSSGDVKGIKLPMGTDVDDPEVSDLQALISQIELFDPADGMEFMDIDKLTWHNDSTNFFIVLSFVGNFNVTKINTTNEMLFGFVGFDMTATADPNIENTTMALAFLQEENNPSNINGTVGIQDPNGYNTTVDNCASLSGKNITWTVPSTNFDENFTVAQLNSFDDWKPYAFIMYMLNDTTNNFTYLYFETLSFDSYLDDIFEFLSNLLQIPGYEPILVILSSFGVMAFIIYKKKFKLN
ncbi:MAG: hypothetical protein GY870_02215 [archaeon]|nr:hypothetical protein [archaeon]